MIVSLSGTAISAAVPDLPAVMAYSVKSARSMDRPYFKRDSATIWSIRRRICSSRPLRPG